MESDILLLMESYIIGSAFTALKSAATPDQLQAARLAALISLRSYNPTKGAQYRTWAWKSIRRDVLRERGQTPAVRVPECARLLLPALQSYEAEFIASEGRAPTPLQISSGVGARLIHVVHVLATRAMPQTDVQTNEDTPDLGGCDDGYAQADAKVDIARALGRLANKYPLQALIATQHLLEEMALEAIAARECLSIPACRTHLEAASAFLRDDLAAYA